MQLSAGQKKKSNTHFLLLLGVLFIAINLRPALASVGPLIEDIRQSTGLSNVYLGLLTTLPLLAFATFSSLTPIFTKRFGIGKTMLGALLLLIIGILLRSVAWIPALYLGTFFLGIAIAFGNVLLPSVTKKNFSSNTGLITSLYSSTMAIGASLAAGMSVPLARQLNLGWRASLAVWAIPALIALIIWLPQIGHLKRTVSNRNYLAALRKLRTSRMAWNVALFMGFQSFTFYVILAWLPDILLQRGFDATFSGWMLSLSQATGVLGSLLIPVFAAKKSNQRSIVFYLISLELIGLLGLLFPALGMVALWVSLIGFVLGGSFGLALLFIVLRSNDAENATELSGMAQSIGYFVAAIGPILFGSLFDITGSWFYPLILLIITALIKLYVGLGAGKAGTV